MTRAHFLFIAFFIAYLINTASAQNPDSKDIHFYQLMNVRNTSAVDAFVGTEYLLDEWYPAEMILKTGAKANLNNAKLNLRSSNADALFLGEEKELLAVFFDEIILNIHGRQRKFYSNKAKDIKGMTDSGFYEELGKGLDKVIVRHYAFIQKPDPQAKILGLETRHKIVKKTNTFILKDGKLNEIKSKKDLKAIYKTGYNKIEAMIKEYDIDIKNPESLARLLELVDSVN